MSFLDSMDRAPNVRQFTVGLCEVVNVWIERCMWGSLCLDFGSSLRRASSCGLENKEISWWACEHKLRSSLVVSTRVRFWTS